MDVTRTFRSVRKNGYDPADVKRVFSDAEVRMQELQQTSRAGLATVDKLERELADLRDALRRSNAKPTFADLGSAFEQTLRVAEEQADKLVNDAEADAKVARESARAEADQLTRHARDKATSLVSAVETQIEEKRLDVEREVAEHSMKAEALLLQGQTIKETAQRRQAAFLAEVERDAAEVRSRLHQEIEDVKTELETLRQITEREQLRIEREIKLELEEAERTRLIRHEDAVALLDVQALEATDIQRNAAEEADALNVQTEEYVARTRQDAEALLVAARTASTNLISRARSRAETLTLLFEEHAADMLQKADRHREILERQREAMREFSLELKALASADAMVSIDESESLGD
jgi:cell division septum initiation protein DivIVA